MKNRREDPLDPRGGRFKGGDPANSGGALGGGFVPTDDDAVLGDGRSPRGKRAFTS